MIDPNLIDAALLGRMAFRPPSAPTEAPLPPGRHALQFPEGREAVLVVPEGLDSEQAVPLLVMFHGAGGEANKVLPHLVRWARARRFLLLAPQSMLPTWDIVIGGHGPDLERLDAALSRVASHFRLDPQHLAFAGFSDGGSYALSVGLTNGDVVSHVIALSAGFMNTFTRHGAPKVFIAHGRSDTQLPFETSARTHALRLLEEGVDLTLLPFEGDHAIVPSVVERAISFFLGAEGP
jgi:predicted esterase